mgnify:CR=1 FL=1
MSYVAIISACSSEPENRWIVESETENYSLQYVGDTIEIVAPKGLTLWNEKTFCAPITFEYEAKVVYENEGDRLSDLNCFWMASDPRCGGDALRDTATRRGNFNKTYALQLYYVGYGGNSNKTTRFRRYNADVRGIVDKQFRPQILTEYTDSAHLLVANHWYKIRIESRADGRNLYFVNNEKLVDYVDSVPLKEGLFGLRTTHSHVKFRNFRAY